MYITMAIKTFRQYINESSANGADPHEWYSYISAAIDNFDGELDAITEDELEYTNNSAFDQDAIQDEGIAYPDHETSFIAKRSAYRQSSVIISIFRYDDIDNNSYKKLCSLNDNGDIFFTTVGDYCVLFD